MKISYSICTCNEFMEIQRLVNHLLKYKRKQDIVTVLYDRKHGDPFIEEYLRAKSIEYIDFNNPNLIWFEDDFNGDFSLWKNRLIQLSNADVIVNLDADEFISQELIEQLPHILEQNPEVDLFWVGRINIVNGITDEHIKKWGWKVDSEGFINWPDPQARIFKKQPQIYWTGKVHETIVGAKNVSALPFENEYCIQHIKDISKQEKQNKLYNDL